MITNLTISSNLFNKLDGNDGYYSSEAFQIMPPANVTPIKVTMATNVNFSNSGMIPYTVPVYIPPGNYDLILLNISIKELGGTQYDRALYVYANSTPIFWGSTQEILNSTAEADLTLFENLLKGPVEFQIVLPNYIVPKIGVTGYYLLNATLYLYPGKSLSDLPNYFIPLFVNKLGYSYVTLNPQNDLAMQSLNLPNGTQKAMLLLYEEGGYNDEFWYTNEPAIRNIEVYYNDMLAGVLNPFQTLYTGGIDSSYWRPVTSINTLSFHTPYYIDLTPLLAMGNQASIAVSVSNLNEAEQLTGSPFFGWDIAGVLMLWVNTSNPMISGQLINAKSKLMDTSPFFIPGYTGIYYQEASSYYINYTSILKFKYGTEYASDVQYGKTSALQTLTSFTQYAYLDEMFAERSYESGFYNSSLSISGNYPVSMFFDFFETPITNPNVIPYNVSFLQNGTLSLNPSYSLSLITGNYNLSESLNYNLKAIGGLGGIMEVINQYGGAVLIGLTNNNAITTKSLTATYLVNGIGFVENFFEEGVQNSTTNLAGYLVKYLLSYTPINFTNVSKTMNTLTSTSNLKISTAMKYISKNFLLIKKSI
ncbi:Peptide N-acetyl-beta-D-glucosaminyl asparaginase amidase A [Caldisphaera lagunensis DSM 15908]|uniref:Peptide N-acetyl-beta-D-glucosaminyl asparaginase amidase A n=1 Tax=Caldisphaera lagunensis (strain DSM 15908 / JCM 11604 / ANMR 0165 / IC-154) TaxID=1056495 RepID=L0A9X9_CALLD|nr:peptide-N4-asparagine amidase [Caldisphaera lagunensis]AFZ69860.1 Peptide N-acetyl-beta-D-glucosaminyl asparaginase amidase A [Caldisphaera lagunensis DSM 15908]